MKRKNKGRGAGYVTLRDHMDALRIADDRFHGERDRRYTENRESERTALSLAREIQSYKDEKANMLREQIGSERGLYPTKAELFSAIEKVTATVQPLADYVKSQQGQRALTAQSVLTFISVVVAIGALVALFVGISK